jgi:hypothetical protein
MYDIKDRLGEYRYGYFQGLQNYLGKDLYFYGSIKRYDYFYNASDIDITIITDNVHSTLSKLQNYLNIKKSKVQKLYQNFNKSSKPLVTGYKITYKDQEHNNKFDILIYDEKYRSIIMDNIDAINNLPLYMIIILIVIKVLYYTIGCISKKTYINLKNRLYNMYFQRTAIMLDS